MELNPVEQKQHAHQMIDLLAPYKLPAVVGMLEALLDPVARAIANAPLDDEPVTEDDRQALHKARQWLQSNEPVPHEQFLAELGITNEYIETYREPA